MKRAALCLFVGLLACLALGQDYRITSFHGDLNLTADGTVHVVERIGVVFEIPRHGIYRDIPIRYTTGKGFTRSLYLSGIQVTDETGRALTTLVTHEGENLHIRIGDKDTLLTPGVPFTYVIRYDCFGQMNWFEEGHEWRPYCELYWNLTGHEWEPAMDKVDFRVTFPKVEGKDSVRARLYTGPYGSRAFQQLLGVHDREDAPETGTFMALTSEALEGGLLAPMPGGSELTFVLDLPANAVHKPTPAEEFMILLKSNLGLTIPLIALVGMLLFWLKYGKDPAKRPIAVQFEPPDNLSGSEAGTLLDERVDQRDIAAGIISLAVKGYLTITPIESGLVFKKRTANLTILQKSAGPELGVFEALLYGKLKAAGGADNVVDETALRTSVAPSLGELKGALYDDMVDKGYYLSNPNNARGIWLAGGIFAVGVLGVIFYLISPTRETLPSIIGGVLGAVIVGIFSTIMPRRTAIGAEAQRRVAGFEEFIRRARGKEIDWQSKKEPTQSLFEEYLPHALAFGLAAEWASAFDGILHEMPNWYNAPPGTGFYPGYFGSDLATIGNSLGSAAATPPRSSAASGGSSGFGGGGFSGGGFGGGGGGSW